MGNVINLNKYRKQKAKREREQQADTNRRLHGRPQAQRTREELQKQQLTRSVDGARLVGPDPSNSTSSASEDDDDTQGA